MQPIPLASLQERFLNRPVALARQQAWLLAAISAGRVQAFVADAATPYSPLYSVVNDIAIVRVSGMLVHGYTWWFCETSYDDIARAVVEAASDAKIKAIVLLVDSPGGEVAGMLDLSDGIYGLRGTKPIWAILDESAYSAAYLIASSADRIIVPRTGGTGSIGTIAQHFDVTGMLDKAGIKVSTFKFGARKGEGWDTIPLTDEAREHFQNDIDAMGDLFVELVARNRNLPVSKVRGMEAACFLGAAGLEQGLVDAVMAPDAAFLSLLDSLN